MRERRSLVPCSTAALATLLGAAWGSVAGAEALVLAPGETVELDGGATFDSVEVGEGATLVLTAPLSVAGDLVVRARGRLTLTPVVPPDAGWLPMSLSVDGGLRVEALGRVDVTGLGLVAGRTIDPPRGTVAPSGVPGSAGGSHFALGGGATGAVPYDDPRDPRLPGSGAGNFNLSPSQGGRGGGVLLAKARTLALDGLVEASGGSGMGTWSGSGGGGGTLNLVVGIFSGTGALHAAGGAADCYGHGGAGGLVRVSYETSDFSGIVEVSGTVSRSGSGCAAVDGGASGSALFVDRATQTSRVVAGTYPLRGGERFDAFELAPGSTARVLGPAFVQRPLRLEPAATLVLAASGALDAMSLASPVLGLVRVEADVDARSRDLTVGAGGQLVVNRRLVLRSLVLERGAVVTHDPQVATMAVEATSALRVRPGARIDATGRGLPPLTTIDPLTLLPVTGSYRENGGSHGGLGGQADTSKPVPPTYDEPGNPSLPGGGAGSNPQYSGLVGGGVLRLRAPLVEVDGLVAANGQAESSNDPGGAGGSVVIEAGSLTGAGEIAANGGSWPEAATRSKAGGGGGLVLLATGSNAFSGKALAEGGYGTVRGGAGKVTWRTVEHPPRIVSVPPAQATAGLPLAYAAQAAGTPPFDWALVAGPAGASVAAATGQLTWTPPELRDADFTLSVSSTFGTDVQSFTVAVTREVLDGGAASDGGARAPFFTSTPSTAASCGAAYRYDGDGLPAVGGGGPFTFSVAPHLEVPLPPTLSVDPQSGELRWTPSRAEVGAHPLELSVESPSGRAVQRFAVIVTCPPPTEFSGCGCGGASAATGAVALALATLLSLLPRRSPGSRSWGRSPSARRHGRWRAWLPGVLAAAAALQATQARAQTLTVGPATSPHVVTDGGVASFEQITVEAGGTLVVDVPLTVRGDLTVEAGGRITISPGVTALRLDVGGTLTVALGGAIDVAWLGLAGGARIDSRTGRVYIAQPVGDSGSHCGRATSSSTSASDYDDPSNPHLPGSSGTCTGCPAPAAGGGAILVSAQTLELEGSLVADGEIARDVYQGAGGGGAINLSLGALRGSGTLFARGGRDMGGAVRGEAAAGCGSPPEARPSRDRWTSPAARWASRATRGAPSSWTSPRAGAVWWPERATACAAASPSRPSRSSPRGASRWWAPRPWQRPSLSPPGPRSSSRHRRRSIGLRSAPPWMARCTSPRRSPGERPSRSAAPWWSTSASRSRASSSAPARSSPTRPGRPPCTSWWPVHSAWPPERGSTRSVEASRASSRWTPSPARWCRGAAGAKEVAMGAAHGGTGAATGGLAASPRRARAWRLASTGPRPHVSRAVEEEQFPGMVRPAEAVAA